LKLKTRTWLIPLMLWLIAIFGNFSTSLNAQNEVTIYYEGNAQAELLCCEGTRILIDVALPDRLSKPATKSDILLTTHMHSDHYNPRFAFPGKKIQHIVLNRQRTLESAQITFLLLRWRAFVSSILEIQSRKV
jgi:hypothetical protein